jgi:hypothetical protein
MKNIHILPTDKPSRLIYNDANQLCYQSNKSFKNDRKNRKKFNIYITFEEEIKDCWFMNTLTNEIGFTKSSIGIQKNAKKIIITTDQDLIKDGVQSVEEDFLYWFVKNPSCEEVKIENVFGFAEIIIPKEERKQHIIDMMKVDEELGLYNETISTEEDAKILLDTLENPPAPNEKLKKAMKERKPEDVFNDEKRQAVARIIKQHKALKSLSLVNPLHLEMTSDGHGEFPNGYKLTEKGIQYIIEKLNTQ